MSTQNNKILTENDKEFIKTVVDYEPNIKKAQKYIKENYNIDSVFNEETLELGLIANSVNESLNILAAKEYLNEKFTEDQLIVK